MNKISDAERRRQALTQLEQETDLRGAEIGITIHDGVATVFGRVETREQKRTAERAVLRVPGIVAVAVELLEYGNDPRWHSDADVAHTVADYLRSEHLAPADTVRARVERAVVTLTGEVDLFHQRDVLEHSIRALPGVSGVINLVRVRPPESQADIHAKVQTAVIRDLANLDPEAPNGRRAGERGTTMVQEKKVLIIDDDDDFRASVRPVLEEAGYLVFEGKSGHEGLAQLVQHDPDAIVLDIMMETDGEGYGVNQAIKYQDEYTKYRGIPVVMVSSIQETPDDRFPRAGELDMIRPDAYLTKPLDIDRFLGVVRRAVARKGRA